MAFYERPEAHLDSNFIQNISNRRLCRPAHGCDRYPGNDGGVMLRFCRTFAGCCGGRSRARMRTLKREPRDSSARATRSARSARRSLPHGAGGDQPISATARRAVLCVPPAILFAVVQWATVPAHAADPIKVGFSMALTAAARACRQGLGAATTDRCAKLSARRPAIARG